MCKYAVLCCAVAMIDLKTFSDILYYYYAFTRHLARDLDDQLQLCPYYKSVRDAVRVPCCSVVLFYMSVLSRSAALRHWKNGNSSTRNQAHLRREPRRRHRSGCWRPRSERPQHWYGTRPECQTKCYGALARCCCRRASLSTTCGTRP